MEEASTRLRLSILGLVAVSLFGALFARLYYLQVMEAPQFQLQAEQNKTRTITEEAPRGRILDRNGKVLVDNRTSLVVKMDRPAFNELSSTERDALKVKLATAITDFGVPTKVADVEEAVNDVQFDPLQPVPVAIDVPEALMVYVAERESEFPSISVVRESVRFYPEGPIAAHLIGYVGPISAEMYEEKQGTTDDPKDNPKPYQPNSEIGREGLEATYEDELRGTPGERVVEVDAKGDPVRTVSHTPPIPGNDVQLTIDLDLQKSTEQALVETLDRQRGTSQTVSENGQSFDRRAQAPGGAAVVVDPNNGGVRAMASYPTYDPAEFVNGISTTRFKALNDDPLHPLLNRAIQGQYAPGSTFKPFTGFSAMESGIMTPSDRQFDDGVYERPNDEKTWANAGKIKHGWVNFSTALTVSSDWYFYHLGDVFWLKENELPLNAQQEGYRQFGFGSPTGIPIPGELAGVVPDRDWKTNLYNSMSAEDQAAGSPDWIPGDNISMAIGQGNLLVTPLQLANAYATLANGGTVYQPQVVWRILAPQTSSTEPPAVVREIAPVVVRQIPLSPEYLDSVRSGLDGVVASASPLGTAYGVFRGFDLAGYPVAGKTGTAQVDGKVDSSWFAAYAPTNGPMYAAAAILEESGNGAEGGAPVVRRIFEQTSGQNQTAATDIGTGTE